jgi:hypothetical protein
VNEPQPILSIGVGCEKLSRICNRACTLKFGIFILHYLPHARPVQANLCRDFPQAEAALSKLLDEFAERGFIGVTPE